MKTVAIALKPVLEHCVFVVFRMALKEKHNVMYLLHFQSEIASSLMLVSNAQSPFPP